MKYLKKKKLNHIINENPQTIILSKPEYETVKKIFCQAKKWKYEKNDGTVNVRRLTITANYKWHPANDIEFDIEVEPDLDLRNKKIKLLQKINVNKDEKPYISIPGERMSLLPSIPFPKRCRCCKTVVKNGKEALAHRKDCVCVNIDIWAESWEKIK